LKERLANFEAAQIFALDADPFARTGRPGTSDGRFVSHMHLGAIWNEKKAAGRLVRQLLDFGYLGVSLFTEGRIEKPGRRTHQSLWM
jgi:hypothetical protein